MLPIADSNFVILATLNSHEGKPDVSDLPDVAIAFIMGLAEIIVVVGMFTFGNGEIKVPILAPIPSTAIQVP